ncbi:MAG: TetR/AcrR family transcriptional regulator [Proteobacteria bacterium]|nr:TetR/AcrR family transcriptional regulator [Desulfobacteraceae bacterium]MBU3980676.1 TetR/AcrR family transcriptional regulator [Pseudomonadota bacterium]MBU4012635.1 TetR/AcrR family transcriptional regulator [Pseudomonadota bacterium]MBU4066942.1 TetR/AcrR family transcriptional regulator [Pseudomonadota bacterium]MBU4100232.1 TetR/AcrR family transcriptional regulator [Pseudomonadota bacterium]
MGIQERKERERGRRRQQIMIAAKRVFSLKGFNKATMEDIANEAELSPGTLYLYFKNKDELCVSLSLRILQYLNIKLKHVGSEKDLEPERKIEALKEAMYDVYEFDPLILINMFHLQSNEILKNLSPQLVSNIKELSASSIKAMADIFEEGIKKNVFIDKNPLALAETLWALFSGIILLEESKRLIDGNKDYLKLTLESAFEIFARGIKR